MNSTGKVDDLNELFKKKKNYYLKKEGRQEMNGSKILILNFPKQ